MREICPTGYKMIRGVCKEMSISNRPMRRNRRINGNMTVANSRVDCEAQCSHLIGVQSNYCSSGVFPCGTGPGGNCHCINMGQTTIAGSGYPGGMCIYNCDQHNIAHNYNMCMSHCQNLSGGSADGYGGDGSSWWRPPSGTRIIQEEQGLSPGKTGFNFRRGGRIRRRRRR